MHQLHSNKLRSGLVRPGLDLLQTEDAEICQTSAVSLSRDSLEAVSASAISEVISLENSDEGRNLISILRSSGEVLEIPYKKTAPANKDPKLFIRSDGFEVLRGRERIPMYDLRSGIALTQAGLDIECLTEKLGEQLRKLTSSDVYEGEYFVTESISSAPRDPNRDLSKSRDFKQFLKLIHTLLRDKVSMRVFTGNFDSVLTPDWCSLHQPREPGSKHIVERNPLWGRFPHILSLFHGETPPDNMHLSRSAFISHLLELGDKVYLKSSLGSGGRGVLRIEKVGSEKWCIETDCLHAHFGLLRHHERRYSSPIGMLRFWVDANVFFYSDLLGAKRSYRSRELTREQITRGLDVFLRVSKLTDPHWLAESEMKTERWHNRRAELRSVFRPLSDGGPHELLGHYMKLSDRAVAGNISKGGKPAETEEVLLAMLRSKPRYQKMHLSQIREHARQEVQSALSISEEVLDGFYQSFFSMTERYGYTPQEIISNVTPMMFQVGVDLVPIWNNSADRFHYGLMELQSGCGISGLKAINVHNWRRLSEKPYHRVGFDLKSI